MKYRKARAADKKTPIPLYGTFPPAFAASVDPVTNTSIPPEDAVWELRKFSEENKK